VALVGQPLSGNGLCGQAPDVGQKGRIVRLIRVEPLVDQFGKLRGLRDDLLKARTRGIGHTGLCQRHSREPQHPRHGLA
jgi:hypothetical protein